MTVIKNGSEVTFAYRIFSGEELMDETLPGQPLMYIHGEGYLIPGLEKGMKGLRAGDKKTIIVQPEEGYGLPTADNIVCVPKDKIPKGAVYHEGDRIPGTSPEGEMRVGKVTKVDKDSVTIDFNHELAGRILQFEVEIIEVVNKTSKHSKKTKRKR
ncbi:MAG: FKBP-type peptidyl-prolyl cis-trans isomerase [Actinomycetota bacterium]|nr:FKBP-type peptidyl-prolyl cis-trans isomerase [Actinomycetota bacterium]